MCPGRHARMGMVRTAAGQIAARDPATSWSAGSPRSTTGPSPAACSAGCATSARRTVAPAWAPRDPYRGPRARGLPGQLWGWPHRRPEAKSREGGCRATSCPSTSARTSMPAPPDGGSRCSWRASAGDARDPLARRAVVLPRGGEPSIGAADVRAWRVDPRCELHPLGRAVAVLPGAPRGHGGMRVMDTKAEAPELECSPPAGTVWRRPRRGGAQAGPATASSAARGSRCRRRARGGTTTTPSPRGRALPERTRQQLLAALMEV